MLKSILLTIILASFVTSQKLSSDEFKHEVHLDLDETFLFKWNYNETHILIEVRGGWKFNVAGRKARETKLSAVLWLH